MDEQKQKMLEKAGIDVKGGLERFMQNDAMFEKYLKKFTENTTYNELVTAVGAGDCKAAFEATHALKGNTGSLSITNLFNILSSQTEFFRKGDFEAGENMMNELADEYYKVINAIKTTLG